MISGDVLGERARLSPEAEALVVVDPPRRFTYRQLDERARRCARVWQQLGIHKGDRVAILAHNRVEYLDAFFAAGKTGIVLVTLGTRLTSRELAQILEDSGARMLLYESSFREIVADLRRGESGPELWLCLDPPAEEEPADSRYLELLDGADPSRFVPTRCDPDDIYCLLYTSGTTGRPKGVMIPHRQVAWNGLNTACCWQLTANDVSPIFTPLYHAGGLMAFLGPIFTAGGTIVLHRDFDVEEIWHTIARERATVLLGFPTIWKMLAESPAFQDADLSSIRFLISGGAPLPTWIAEIYQRRGATFKQGFGMTEVGVNCFSMTEEESVAKLGSIGKPMMYTDVRLVDEKGNDVVDGEVGEMCFRGPHVSLGYWNRPEATSEAHQGGWFRSGDLARRDADGFYYIAGRAKDMIISGGVNIFPAEIEAVLLQHPEIRDAAVVGVESDQWGEVGVAFVVPMNGGDSGDTRADSIRRFLAEHLSRYKLPRDFVFVDELPRTAYGKVVKGELRQSYSREGSAP